MKTYRYHPCGDRHSSWPSLAACCWPHATVEGDGPFAAASCGARAVTLYTGAEQAQARKRSLDRDGCRPGCHQHHHVIALAPAHEKAKPPKTASAVTRRATTPAAPPPLKPERPICGRPRTNGQPCRRPAGWGADPGEKHCRDHGGSVAGRIAEKERLVEQALTFAQLVARARTTPLTAEEQLQAEAAARNVLKGRTVRRGWPLCSPCLEVPGLGPGSLGLLVAALSRRPGGEVS